MGCNNKNSPEHPGNRHVSTVAPVICPDDAQHMERRATCRKINNFKEVCRSKKFHNIDPQEEQHHDEDDIDKVNINSINIDSITFNSKWSFITANLNASSTQATVEVPY